jgi:hypothetical protein
MRPQAPATPGSVGIALAMALGVALLALGVVVGEWWPLAGGVGALLLAALVATSPEPP